LRGFYNIYKIEGCKENRSGTRNGAFAAKNLDKTGLKSKKEAFQNSSAWNAKTKRGRLPSSLFSFANLPGLPCPADRSVIYANIVLLRTKMTAQKMRASVIARVGKWVLASDLIRSGSRIEGIGSEGKICVGKWEKLVLAGDGENRQAICHDR